MDIAERRNTYSYKWDVKENELPMWVADMDFMSPKCVKDAIIERAQIGAYGYSYVPDEFFDAYREFWLKNHGIEFKNEEMIYTTGVVPAISSIVRTIANEGDNVVILSPVYNIFYNSIRNSNRVIVTSDLLFDGKNYSINYDDLEKKLEDFKTKLLIFCNPHNPVGKIWSLDDLSKVYDLCIKHNVIILSDEIHCDIVKPGLKYNSFGLVGKKNLITCISASKCFNLAGLQAAVAIVFDSDLRYKVSKGLNRDEVAENNFFSVAGHIAALTKADDFLREVNEYVFKNREYATYFINKNLENVNVIEGVATYLLWVDVRKYTLNTNELVKFIREKTGLIISSGDSYGDNAKGFLRINLATTLDNVIDGMNRFKTALDLWKE